VARIAGVDIPRDKRIEVALNGNAILHAGADQRWFGRPVDADAVDAG